MISRTGRSGFSDVHVSHRKMSTNKEEKEKELDKGSALSMMAKFKSTEQEHKTYYTLLNVL